MSEADAPKLEVHLTRINTVEVTTDAGTSLGLFHSESEWNGLIKLVNETGACVIVWGPTFSQGLFDCLGIGNDDRTSTVVTASPSLLAEIIKPKQ